MSLGVKHLGFLIGIDVTTRLGARHRVPGRGVCSECGKHRDKVYVRGDGAPYCDHCIEFDIAEARPTEAMIAEQKHPTDPVVEILYEKIASVIPDHADLRVYEQAFQ